MKEQDEAEKGESVIDGMHILVKVHVPGIVFRDILFPHPMIQIEDGDNCPYVKKEKTKDSVEETSKLWVVECCKEWIVWRDLVEGKFKDD